MRQSGSMAMAALAGIGLAGCIEVAPEPVSGRALYTEYCAACHGSSARGTAAAPDLTRLSARAGGTYPLVAVLAKIDGYTRDTADGMPEFGNMLEGPTMLVDTGDGVLTPTPEPLVALAEYLRALQR